MNKIATTIIAGLVLCGVATAQTFTDVNNHAYWGKTEIPKLTETLDANFALVESGADITPGDVTISGDVTVIGSSVTQQWDNGSGKIQLSALASDVFTNALVDGSTLPAVDGSAVTNLTAENITAGASLLALDGSAVTNLTAENILAAGSISAIDGGAITNLTAENLLAAGSLSAVDGASVTNLTAANLLAGGTLSAVDGAAVTNLSAENLAGVITLAVQSVTDTNTHHLVVATSSTILVDASAQAGSVTNTLGVPTAAGQWAVIINNGASNTVHFVEGTSLDAGGEVELGPEDALMIFSRSTAAWSAIYNDN